MVAASIIVVGVMAVVPRTVMVGLVANFVDGE
jgi:hypothetical protein